MKTAVFSIFAPVYKVSTWALAGVLSFAALGQQDAPPVDLKQLLQALKGLREQQISQAKASRQKAIQDVSGPASSGPGAAAAWEEAVRQTQFQGASREGAQFKDWKEKEGDAFGEKEVQSAARLYFNWMQLTLQRAGGAQVKDLMPQILQHVGAVIQDRTAVDLLDERIRHERETAQLNKRQQGKDKRKDDDAVKRLHDQILGRPLANGAPAQALRVTEFLSMKEWEMIPGNTEGIYQQIVLPEFRATRDPRLLEYWEMKLKREADLASKSKLAYEIDKFNQVRRPELLWLRCQDMVALGLKNRAMGEMFALIKANPAHPQCANWIVGLEKLILPPAPPEPSVGTEATAPTVPPVPSAGDAAVPLGATEQK
jgi:hypothetical protein